MTDRLHDRAHRLAEAWLHDPPDKALDIRGHVSRAKRYLEAAGFEPSSEFDSIGDQLASNAERLPVPDPQGDYARFGVGPVAGALRILHPLSAEPLHEHVDPLVGDLDEGLVTSTIADIVSRIVATAATEETRFLSLWRHLPDQLGRKRRAFAFLPAETRQPDHTIWHHVDIASALQIASAERGGRAYLSFQIGPVQEFIEASRTVRDLWSGSALLSWLVLAGMRPVLERVGPTAFVFPLLRGSPLVDLWLREKDVPSLAPFSGPGTPVLSLPHKFLAVVPRGDGDALLTECREAVEIEWLRIASEVRRAIDKGIRKRLDPILSEGWDQRWDEQVRGFFSAHTSLLPASDMRSDDAIASLVGGKDTKFATTFSEIEAVRQLSDALSADGRKPGYDRRDSGRWSLHVEMSARVMEAQRRVARLPVTSAVDNVPGKCSLLGTWEQMGPAGLDQSREFWERLRADGGVSIDGVRLRSGERLSAPSLIRRFAAPVVLADEIGRSANNLRFPDTATIGAREWLQRAAIDPAEVRDRKGSGTWSGQWLHWTKRDLEQDDACPGDVWDQIRAARKQIGAPPAYYAIVRGDGDHMGRWLRGDKAPPVREVLHPKIREYYEGLAAGGGAAAEHARAGLDAKRPSGPALHAAISEALTNFSVHAVPDIVNRHLGTLIYAGGDDFLALVPARNAIEFARDLRLAFSGLFHETEDVPRGWWQPRATARDGTSDPPPLLMMGPDASCSIGVVVVHHKENLRDALELARSAEDSAKRSGRDALVLTVSRRSGECATTLLAAGSQGQVTWHVVQPFQRLVDAFSDNGEQNKKSASAGWAYRLRYQAPVLEMLGPDAHRREIERMIQRSDRDTRDRLDDGKLAIDLFDAFLASREGRTLPRDASNGPLESFAMLCQSAFFLARGRDERGQ